MIYVTSFNRAMYERRGRFLLESLVGHTSPSDRIWAFHEDAHEAPEAPFSDRADFGGRVKYFDVFRRLKSLEKVIKRPQFDQAAESENKEERFLNYHAQFFARKVAAIRVAAFDADEPMVWLDSDNVVNAKIQKGNLSPYLEKLGHKYDICFKDRKGRDGFPSETSFVVFKAHTVRVKTFIEFWWRLYETEGLHHLKLWADANVFDFCRDMHPKLKYCDLFGIKPGWRTFHHRTGHREMARLRRSTKPGKRPDLR